VATQDLGQVLTAPYPVPGGTAQLYERGIVLNINAPYPEVESQETYLTVDPVNHRLGTGTMTITLDLDANLVWGEFTFTAKGMEDSNLEVSMTGSFLVRLEVFE